MDISAAGRQRFSSTFERSTASLALTGDLDEATAPRLRDVLARHSENHTRYLRLDLTAVSFLPSVAIGVIATAMSSARCNGTDLALITVEGTLAHKVLKICALPHTLRRADTNSWEPARS